MLWLIGVVFLAPVCHAQMFKATIFVALASIQISYNCAAITPDSQCGSTKGCYPTTCPVSGCTDFHLSWEDEGEFMRFRMISTISVQGDAWAAVGFSTDKLMKNTSVVMCRTDTSGAEIGHTDAAAYTYKTLNTTSSLANVTVARNGSYLTCHFSRVKVPKEFPSQIFPLNLTTLYILEANGLITKGDPVKHTRRAAGTNPVVLMEIDKTTSAPLSTEPTSTDYTSPLTISTANDIISSAHSMFLTCAVAVTLMLMP